MLLTPAYNQGLVLFLTMGKVARVSVTMDPPANSTKEFKLSELGMRVGAGGKSKAQKRSLKVHSTPWSLAPLSLFCRSVCAYSKQPGFGGSLVNLGQSMVVHLVGLVLEIKEFRHKYKYVFSPWRVC